MRLVLVSLIVFGASAAAWGCGNDGDDPPSPTPTSAAAPPTTPAAQATPSGTAATPASQATPSVTEQVDAVGLGDLSPLLIGQAVVPAGFRLRSDQPATARQIAVANVGIPEFSIYLGDSDLEGAWTKFFTRDEPNAGLSSIVYRFATPEGAQGFVDAIGQIETADYPAATSVERVQADSIEDASQMMRYRLQGSRTLEYTWAQGRLAGQVLLRYAGDTESPEDVSTLVAMARQQAELMRRHQR